MMNILNLIRVEQWVKNLLIFSVPLLANQFGFDVFNGLVSIFFGFSLIASSGYIINDILDLEFDKQHYTKKKRMLASGKISIPKSKIILLICFSLGSLILLFQSLEILFISLIYLFLSICYSKYLKYLKYVYLGLISLFFVIRVHIGSIGSDIETSIFLNLLVFFSSLSIVTSKKLSILSDKNIKISKVKDSISNNYDFSFLDRLLIFSIVLAFVTFNIWILLKPDVNIIYIGSDILFIIFSTKFYKLTKQSETEDFLNTLKTQPLLSFYILLFILFTLYGIMF